VRISDIQELFVLYFKWELMGGRSRTDKVGVGAVVDIVATGTSQVWCVHIDKIAIVAFKAVNFLSDAEQLTCLPCGIVFGLSASSPVDTSQAEKKNFGCIVL
jgi:hypothetical protein